MLTYKKACEIRDRMHEMYSDDSGNGSTCAKCPISSINNGTGNFCNHFMVNDQEKAEKILTDWDEVNPVYTILDEFKANYPNAKLRKNGTPYGLCPDDIGYEDVLGACSNWDDDGCVGCRECWAQPAKKKVGGNV